MSRTEKNRRGALLLLLADTMTLFCLLAGGLGSYFSTSRFAVETGPLLVWCFFLALGGTVMHKLRCGSLIALGLLVLEGLLIWWNWDRFQFGQWLGGGSLYSGGMEFAFLLIALALLLGWVVVKARCWYLAALAVSVPVLPAILRGDLPDWASLLTAAAGWLSMLLTGLYDHRDRAGLAKAQLMSLTGVTVLLLLLTALLPQENYKRPQWATSIRTKIAHSLSGQLDALLDLRFAMDGYLELDGVGLDIGIGVRPYFAVDTSGEVNLMAAGPRRYTGREVLEISAEASQAGERVYLSGGSAMDYTGFSWEGGVPYEPAGGQPYPHQYPAMTAPELPEKTMTIRHITSSGGTAFYPYQVIDFQNNAAELSGDSGAKRAKSHPVYQVAYRSNEPYQISAGLDAALGEAGYREYVYDHYLAVPEETQKILQPVLDYMEQALPYAYDISGLPMRYLYVVDNARRTAAVLALLARYDLDTPAASPGEDFVRHFLEEGRGYCVHFATAGALLLRMRGIPARYTSGYTARLNSEGTAVVKDRDAHAWVEIYLDGYGWYPVEMTPGMFGRIDAAAEEDARNIPAVEESDIPDEPDEPDEPEIPSGQEPERPKPETPEPDSPEEVPELDNGEISAQPEPQKLRWLWGAAAVLLAAAVPAAVYRAGQLARRRSREQPDTNRSCVCAYRRCRRAAFWGGEMPQALEDLAQKAAFSQHKLTGEERETAWRLAEEAFRELEERLPWWKRAACFCLKPFF